MVGELLPGLLDNIGNIHPWSVFKDNPPYLSKMQHYWGKLMEIRDILALSHINLHDYATKRANGSTPTETERLVHQFAANRPWVLSNQRHGIKPEELFFYSDEATYLQQKPLSQDDVLSQYPTKYNKYFFEIKQAVPPGDNPFIFNTIHIKDPSRITVQKAAQGGVGELRRTAFEMAYVGSDHILTFSDEKPPPEEFGTKLTGKVW